MTRMRYRATPLSRLRQHHGPWRASPRTRPCSTPSSASPKERRARARPSSPSTPSSCRPTARESDYTLSGKRPGQTRPTTLHRSITHDVRDPLSGLHHLYRPLPQGARAAVTGPAQGPHGDLPLQRLRARGQCVLGVRGLGWSGCGQRDRERQERAEAMSLVTRCLSVFLQRPSTPHTSRFRANESPRLQTYILTACVDY